MSVRLLHANLSSWHKLLLTHRQIQRLIKLLQSGKGGMVLDRSPKQVKHKVQKEGGFLSMLAGLASAALTMLAETVLPALDALSGLSSAAIQKAMGPRLHHNNGGKVCCVKLRGRGLNPNTYGDGLYLKILRLKWADPRPQYNFW